MRRLSAQRIARRISLSAALSLCLAYLPLQAQSLGDVARENRDKKAAQAAPAKVITNSDLTADSDDSTTSPPAKPQMEPPSSSSSPASRRAAAQRAAEERSAQQWKQRILTQKRVIANLQGRVDALRAAIQFVDTNGYSNGLVYNQYQARQLERLKVLEVQLEQQQQELDELQEAARHAGMHTPVYDP